MIVVDKEYLVMRKAQIEASKAQFIANAQTCDGALQFITEELLRIDTPEPTPPVADAARSGPIPEDATEVPSNVVPFPEAKGE